MTEQEQGLFTQSQEELTSAVYDSIIYKPRAQRIAKEISKRLADEK
jgi:hypothetical protein